MTPEEQAASGNIFAYGGNVVSGKTNERTPVGVLSTQQGIDFVNKGNETLAKLSPNPKEALPGEDYQAYQKRLGSLNEGLGTGFNLPGAKAGQTETPTANFINAETGQTITKDTSTMTPDELASLNAQGFSLMDSTGNVPSWIAQNNPELGKMSQELTQAKSEFDSLKNDISKFTISDAELQGQVQAITNQWNARISDMERINKQREKSISTLGVRLGSRYTGGEGGVFGGIIAEEERQGVSRIAELEANKQSAIAAAKEAARTKNWEIYAKQLGLAETAYKEKLDAVKELAKTTAENNKKIREQEIRASRDSAIAGLVAQGISNPTTISELLGGEFTAEEIGNALKVYSPENKAQNLPQDIETFNWLVKNDRIPSSITSLPKEQQYFAYLKMLKSAEKGTTGGTGGEEGGKLVVGTGAANETEETAIRTRLFSKLMNILNKGQVSDSDRKIIDERITLFRNAGWSEQKIMDTLSGFPAEVATPYNNTFRDLIVQNTDNNDIQTQLMSKVALLLNNKNYNGAMTAVENQAMLNAKRTDPDNYLGTASADTYLTKVQKIRELLNKGGVVGFVSGSFENILGKIKGPEAARIKADLTSLYAQFRKEYLGSAVTPSEEKFLTPLLADISDTKGNFIEKLNSFERNTLYKYNATRSSVGLPEVNTSQVVSPEKRLGLYQGTTGDENPFSEVLGGTATSTILDSMGGYIIPK